MICFSECRHSESRVQQKVITSNWIWTLSMCQGTYSDNLAAFNYGYPFGPNSQASNQLREYTCRRREKLLYMLRHVEKTKPQQLTTVFHVQAWDVPWQQHHPYHWQEGQHPQLHPVINRRVSRWNLHTCISCCHTDSPWEKKLFFRIFNNASIFNDLLGRQPLLMLLAVQQLEYFGMI